jgi:hypothetical protein
MEYLGCRVLSAVRVRWLVTVGVTLAVATGPQGAALAAPPPAYTVADVGAFGGEPSIVSDSSGQLYDTTPSGGTITYTSINNGATWRQVTTADPNSGDDCLATDQQNAVYLCNLAGSQGVAPLQGDVWKSLDHGTTWTHGAGVIPQCATSCSPFGVDRDWVAAKILPPATQTSQAEVVLMYHDFFGPSQIWVNTSHDGGATFGPPQEVLASPAVTPGAVTLPACEYDMYVVWSSDGGKTWDGGGGLIPGSAAKPYRVNPPSETGTHFFPALAAGDPGQVEVAYLRTPEIVPTDAFGKANPGGCAGPGAPGNPPTYPPACAWNLFAGQSLNLTLSPAAATWAITQITTTPMHIGDICNLGIFCVAPSSNRNLLDFISETLDPRGCAHIAFADDNTVNTLRVANQTAGCLPKK